MQVKLVLKVELKIWDAREPEKLRFSRNGANPLETGGGNGPGEAMRPELLSPVWCGA